MIALGSLADTGYLIEVSHELAYLKENDFKELIGLQKETISSLKALINYYRKKGV